MITKHAVLLPESLSAGRLWKASASRKYLKCRGCFYDSDSAEHLKKCLELACAYTFPLHQPYFHATIS